MLIIEHWVHRGVTLIYGLGQMLKSPQLQFNAQNPHDKKLSAYFEVNYWLLFIFFSWMYL